MKRIWICLLAALCLLLSACCGDGEPCGLLLVNNSRDVIYAVSVDWEDRTMGVVDAGGRALLERGDTLGFALEGETGPFTITISDQAGRTLARGRASYRGYPLWLTLEADRSLSVLEEVGERG